MHSYSNPYPMTSVGIGQQQSAAYSTSPPAPPDSLSYQSQLLAETLKRLDERIDALCSLADFLIGTEPPSVKESSLKPVPSGLVAELTERIAAVDMRINALAHEYSRLERALRG